MTLWRRLPVETGQPFRFVPASPAEILEAARPHADLEAAAQAIGEVMGWQRFNPPLTWFRVAKAAVDAALGADDE